MTDLALIPPFQRQFESIRQGGLYLFLPQHFHDLAYREYVKKAVETASWTILDNGAFEGDEIGATDLVDMALNMNINEIVIPDALGDSEETYDKLVNSAETLDTDVWAQKRFMTVVQGESFGECCKLIDDIVFLKSEYALIGLKAFGIPKHLGKTTKGSEWAQDSIRLRLASYIRHKYDRRFQVHFLGANPRSIHELGYLKSFEVRSVDTSMPYVYAFQGLDLSDAYVNEFIDLERQEGYFDSEPDSEQDNLIEGNISYLQRLVNNV